MVHCIATLLASSVHIIPFGAVVKYFRIFSHDFNQAYFQSRDKLTSKIFILRKQEDSYILVITEDEVMELLPSLYGICCVGGY